MRIEKHFASYSALLDAVTAPAPEHARRLVERSSRDRGRGFAGTATYQEALDLAAKGWPAGREKFAGALDALRVRMLHGQGTKRRRRFAFRGRRADLARYMAGRPDCMIQFRQNVPSTGRAVTVNVNSGALGDVSPDTMIRRGAACSLLVESLESAGYDVTVILSTACRPSGRGGYGPESSRWIVTVPIKGAGQYLEPDRLAFALGNPAYHRRFIFALRENEPVKVKQHFGFYATGNNSGYGRTETHKVKGAAVNAPGLRNNSGPFGSDAGAIAWVKEALAKLGIDSD